MPKTDYEDFTAIGEILVRRGMLTERQLQRALSEQKKRQKSSLGDLLVELKICDRQEVDSALEEQFMSRLPSSTFSATAEAKEMLAAAFAKVEREFGRMEKKHTGQEILALKISGDD
jgi:hypothetical protein